MTTEQSPKPLPCAPKPDSEAKWLALTLRQGLLLIVREIERRYEVGPERKRQDRDAA